MKALAYKLFVGLSLVAILFTLLVSAVNLYSSLAFEDVYDVTYLDQVDATCVKTLYHGKAIMSCMPGNRLGEVTP